MPGKELQRPDHEYVNGGFSTPSTSGKKVKTRILSALSWGGVRHTAGNCAVPWR